MLKFGWAYLARVGEGGMSAELWLTDAPYPRTRWVSSGWRSSCAVQCPGSSGTAALQKLLAAHRCPPCCRTLRATGRWNQQKLASDSGWPSRTALRGFASIARRAAAAHITCAHREDKNRINANCSNEETTVLLFFLFFCRHSFEQDGC